MVIVINSNKTSRLKVLFAAVMFFLAILHPAETVLYVREALSICGNTVIPALFPFTVLTGIITSNAFSNRSGRFFAPVARIFKISTVSLSALLFGMICGFPIGGKIAIDLYKKKMISREETERLIAFTNNTGPAFAIGAVGCVILGNIALGVLIYITQIIISLAAGIILGIGKKLPIKATVHVSREKISTAKNISDASSAVLTVCGFVVFFYFTVHCLGDIMPIRSLKLITAVLLEVSCGASESAALTDPAAAAAFTAFSVGWSGLSVHMQLNSFLSSTDLSMKKYYITKLISGTVHFIIVFLILKLNIISEIPKNDSHVFAVTYNTNGICYVIAIVIIFMISFALSQLEKRKNICYNTDIGRRKDV